MSPAIFFFVLQTLIEKCWSCATKVQWCWMIIHSLTIYHIQGCQAAFLYVKLCTWNGNVCSRPCLLSFKGFESTRLGIRRNAVPRVSPAPRGFYLIMGRIFISECDIHQLLRHDKPHVFVMQHRFLFFSLSICIEQSAHAVLQSPTLTVRQGILAKFRILSVNLLKMQYG